MGLAFHARLKNISLITQVPCRSSRSRGLNSRRPHWWEIRTEVEVRKSLILIGYTPRACPYEVLPIATVLSSANYNDVYSHTVIIMQQVLATVVVPKWPSRQGRRASASNTRTPMLSREPCISFVQVMERQSCGPHGQDPPNLTEVNYTCTALRSLCEQLPLTQSEATPSNSLAVPPACWSNPILASASREMNSFWLIWVFKRRP